METSATGLIDTNRFTATAQRVDVLGVPVDALNMRATVERCVELMERGRGHMQVSVNAAKLVRCAQDERMARFVRRCDVISADGQSVVWAARTLGHPLPERVAGIDLMQELIAAAERREFGVYILGAKDDVLSRAVTRLRAQHPRLRIVGTHHGYFSPEEEEEVAREILDASPNLLLVAMSSPRKEEWLDRNIDRLRVPLSMGVGGAIEVVAGTRTRAPRWMQSAGLEWLHRLLQEPRRMWRRYFVGNLRFAWLVARQRFIGRT